MYRRHWAAALIFLALTLVLTNPLALHLANAVEDKQDALLNTWILAWIGHAALANPLNLYNANIFYPYPDTLAFSEILVPQGLLALPVTLATDNPVLSYNLVLLAMFWLDAFAMYLLVLDWTDSSRAGWIAGVIYAFNPFNLSNLAQVQLLSLGWTPLAILFLMRLLQVTRSSPRPRSVTPDVVLFALFFILQTLSAIYYGLFAGFAVIIYLCYWLWTERTRLFRMPTGAVRTCQLPILLALSRLVISLLLIALVLVPFLLPYFSVQRELGFQRTVQESEPFSASLQQFAQVAPQNVLYGHWLAPNPVRYNGGYPLDDLFPGLVALVLAGIGLVRGARSRERWFLLALLTVAFVLALGPRLYLTFDQATDVTLPYRWLFDLLVPLRALRAPVRFEVLIMFALAGLAGFGFCALAFAKRPLLASLGVIALIVCEYTNLPGANTTVVPVASEIPPVYKWLAQQASGVVLELPMMGRQDLQDPLHVDISNQYFSAYHWHPTPDGFSGFFAPGRKEIGMEMESFPSARAISLMQALDVRYLVVHFDQLTPAVPRKELEQRSGLTLLQEFGTVAVYQVAPPRLDPDQLSKQLYLPRPAQAGAKYMAYLIASNPLGWPFSSKPTDRLNVTARWSDGRQEQLSAALPLVTSAASVVPIPLTAPAHAGKFSLQLESKNGLWGSIELGGEVEVGPEPARQVVIPAQVRLAKPLETEYHRGETVAVPIVWQTFERLSAYYSASVRVVDAQGRKITNRDREPRGQTFLWKPDEQVQDRFELTLPADLIAGSYSVQVLMYQAETDTSVLLLDGNFTPREVTTLGEFQVK